MVSFRNLNLWNTFSITDGGVFLPELLRKSAEHSLMDMVQLLFSRLPQFSEDVTKPGYFSSMNKKLKMRTGSGLDTTSRNNRRRKNRDALRKSYANRTEPEAPINIPDQSNGSVNKVSGDILSPW